MSDELAAVGPELASEVEQVLIPAARIQERLREVARELDADYAGRDLLMVGVLKGAFVVMADLIRELTIPVSVDFMAVSSYGSSTRSSGVVRILKDLDTDIEGRHVLIIEDILDSGLTLDYLLKNLWSRRPASLEVFALLRKPASQKIEVPVRYEGFDIEEVFVVGYGLDYAERYRNLPFIATLDAAAFP